jgi:hypothetical protein
MQYNFFNAAWTVAYVAPLISRKAQLQFLIVSGFLPSAMSTVPPLPPKESNVNVFDREGHNLVYESNKPLLSNLNPSQNAQTNVTT